MRYSKINPILRASVSNINDSATPSSITYAYNIGSLLGMLMSIMIITGILLALHYIASASTAFDSVIHIMNDISFGTIIRYCHANIASLIFISLYAHITRNIYYSSFRAPRTSTWLIGIVILVLAIGTAFLGYSLVFGQMSLWGATVICSLFSAIPIFGNYISILLWGAFSVSSSTITRFFALHYLFALIVISAAIVHLLMLHMHSSSTPLGISGNYDRHAMSPIFLVKDSITMIMSIMVLLFLVSYIPNYLSHSDNYVVANSLVTPSSIVPEWYLLTYYAILRSVPNKLVGVILMLLAIVWLGALILDVSIIRSNSYKIVTRILLVLGLYCFVVLLSLGSKHIEAPYIVLGQSTTLIYFITLLFALPSIGILENYLMSRNDTDTSVAHS